jgi:hypothetical protein
VPKGAKICFYFQLVDDGIARGNDALTSLENRSTYTLFINELYHFEEKIQLF